MKKDSDDLHQLVSTLTMPEKRYCSLYLKKHNSAKDNRYLKLFNYLQREGDYDGDWVRKQMKYADKPNHYAVLKKQLNHQLLDALHQFSLFTDPEERLMRGIYQCSLLLQRGLFAQCEKQIGQLEKTAVEIDSVVGQFKLQGLKLSAMHRKKFAGVTDADMQRWDDQSREILRAMATNVSYAYLVGQVNKIQNETEPYSKELLSRMEELMKMPEYRDEKTAHTLQSKIYYYNTQVAYHYHHKTPQKAREYQEKTLLLLEAHPHIRSFGSIYRVALDNYMRVCLALKEYDLFLTGLEKFRNLPKVSESWNMEKESTAPIIFSVGYQLEMDYLMETGNFDAAYAKIKPIRQGLRKFGDRIVGRQRNELQFAMAYASFGMAQYDEALDYLLPLTQIKDVPVAEQLQLGARLLQLFCHFEKGDRMLLESLAKSLQRSIRGKDEAAEVHRMMLSFILSSLRQYTIEKKSWNELHKKLNALPASVTEKVFDMFNYKVWARAHADGIGFAKAWGKEMKG